MNKMTKSSPTKKGAPPKNFESAMQELENITARLEQGEAPLDEVVSAYERGALLIEFCRQRLQSARGKIEILEKQTLTDMDDVGE